jgi:hypothetical protein
MASSGPGVTARSILHTASSPMTFDAFLHSLQSDNYVISFEKTSFVLTCIEFQTNKNCFQPKKKKKKKKKLAPQGSHCKKFYLKGVRKPPQKTSGNIRKSHQRTNLKTSAFATTYLQTFQYLQIYQLLLHLICRL